ncbi:TonB-dependent receptor [Adhaeribacter swui]|uniref:TonB-dependent receptor n=1 Tax=Adhaeribacter swui TaxID=2086471 RepID=A0A7G7G546_9BACT|nr:TonB-dependent receptor [Adhaeribacter swui]QNF32280.1 TonB-dependent receptor [Adhaeribacter swui]
MKKNYLNSRGKAIRIVLLSCAATVCFAEELSASPVKVKEIKGLRANVTLFANKSKLTATTPSANTVKLFRPADIIVPQATSATGNLLNKPAKQISGKVTSESGEALIGVTVVLKGTTTGSSTDVSGNYSLEVPDNGGVLVFSYIGYIAKEVEIGNATTLNITLLPDTKSLDEVVVVGYGTESKRNLINSVASVDSKAIEDRPVVNFEQSLAGKIPGVTIAQSNGAPGGGMTINVRGVGSITGGTQPLYVIDGLPLSAGSDQGNDNFNYSLNPLNSINPTDIESIQVLKDAAATAIYGSRGSNGVVIITTKKGALGEKPTITFNAYAGVSQLAKKVDVMNAYEHANYTKLARDLSWISKDPVNHKASDPLNLRNIDDRYPAYMLPYINGEPGLTDTNWQDEFYRTGKVQSYDLAVSGGTTKTRYYVSANYLNQEGIIPNSGIERVGVRLNLDTELSSKLRIGVNLNPTYIDNNLARSEKNWGDEGLVIGTLMQHPELPVYNPDGSYAVDKLFQTLWSGESNVVQFQNPVALANLVDNRMKQFGMKFNANVEYDITSKLTFKTTFGSDINFNDRKYYRPKSLSYRTEPAPTTFFNYGSVFNSNSANILWDNTLSYTESINNDHNINILLGSSMQKEVSKDATAEGRNFATDNVRTINTAQERYSSEDQREWSLLSYFGRANYNFRGKYLVSATVRADGSSRFGSNTKWGVFPSVSLGWRVSDEAFFQNDFVNDLKLRASYGLTGNNNIPYYGSIALLSTGGKYPIGDVVQSGLYPSTAPNPNLSWETTKTIDAGFDFTFLKYYTFTADYYHSHRTDLLLNVPVPSASGYSSSLQNIGELQNRGIELALGTARKVGPGELSVGVNFSANRNKVLALGPGQEQIISSGGLSGSHITRVGQPVGSFFGYKVIGRFESADQLSTTPKLGNQQIGDFIYQDTNGDKVVNADDRVILGDNYPDYQIGFNFSYKIKGFDISASVYSQQGLEVMNTMHRYLAEAWGNNLSVYLDEDAPRPVWGVGSSTHTRASSWQVEDASFVRLREVIVGYSLPNALTNKLHISRVRVYASLLNPVTWTKYSGYNPEVSSNYGSALTPGEEFGNYPLSKTSTIGINVSF